MRLVAVLGLFLVLQNEPPQHTQAHPAAINNSVQVQTTPVVTTPTASQAVEPKPEPVIPQPEPEQPVVETAAAVQPPAPKPVHPVGCEHYRALVSQYDWNVEVALQVMRYESGCNPNAVGDQRVIGGIYAPSCGLMQIRTLQGRPDCETLKDPATNLEWAYKLYQGSGWKPWSVCRTKVSCY